MDYFFKIGLNIRTAIMLFKEITMKWTTPAAQDMRFGFEITMYIANR